MRRNGRAGRLMIPPSRGRLLEANLIHMEQLGKDPALSAREALAEVARLAASAGSRIESFPKPTNSL